jgi:hypothetical protein
MQRLLRDAGYPWNESVIPIQPSAYRRDLRQEPDEAIPQVRIRAGGCGAIHIPTATDHTPEIVASAAGLPGDYNCAHA